MSRTIKVRIAVAVDSDGEWNSFGHGGSGANRDPDDSRKMGYAVEGIDAGEKRYWLEAELEVPGGATVQAIVSEERG